MPYLWLPDLKLIGVFDPNVPQKERVVIRPTCPTNLAGVGIGVGVKSGSGAHAIHDNVFWFPEVIVEPPGWIFLYTGSGQMRQTTMPNSREPALVYHWSRQYTVFTQPEFVPILFRVFNVIVGERPPHLR